MSDKLKNLKKQYKCAVDRFREVLAMEKNAFIRDSAIQRFEFTVELAWKAMQEHLKRRGADEIDFPKDVIRAAFKARLVDNDARWLEMVDTRNKTSHLYKESMAEEIYAELRKYLPLFENLIGRLE